MAYVLIIITFFTGSAGAGSLGGPFAATQIFTTQASCEAAAKTVTDRLRQSQAWCVLQ